MPSAVLRACLEQGCSARVPKGRCATHRRDPAQQVRRKLYKTKRWERFSKAYRDRHPLCVECERNGYTTLAIDVHHRIPIRDGVDPFDWRLVEGLCKPCHLKATTAEQRARAEGRPITATHHDRDNDYIIA